MADNDYWKLKDSDNNGHYWITKKLGKIHCSLSVRKLLKYHIKYNLFVFIKRSIVRIIFFSVQK